MTPQEAKTKISQLLELGTLQGVKVEYEYGEKIVFEKSFNGEINRVSLREDNISIRRKDVYANIKSIHPIPLQPKLLEVGTRVKVIGGRHKEEMGHIIEHYGIGYKIALDSGGTTYEEMFHLIPESLLVEEEESEVMSAVASANRNIQVGAATIKALEQAGYKITKE